MADGVAALLTGDAVLVALDHLEELCAGGLDRAEELEGAQHMGEESDSVISTTQFIGYT